MAQRRQIVRRLILEESSGSAEPSETAATTKSPGKRKKKKSTAPFAVGAQRRHQKKTTDLIPKRFLAIALVFLALVSGMAVLNFLAMLPGQSSSESFKRSLAISGPGTLSAWFSSFLLILTALASLQIYAMRQFRNNDYRGTYKLWLWLAAIFVIGSLNCVVDFMPLLKTFGAFLFPEASSAGFGKFAWWLIGLKFAALTGLVIRGVLEIRASRAAIAAVVVVWVAYASATVMQIPAVQDVMVVNHESIYGNCVLIGTISLFMTVVLYARFMFLFANGMISVVQKSTVTKKKKKDTKESSAKAKRVTRKTKASASTQSKTKTIDTASASDEKHRSRETESAKPRKRKETSNKSRSAKMERSQTGSNQKSSKSKRVEPRKGLMSPLAAKMQSMSESDSGEHETEEFAEIINLREKTNLNKAERRRLKKLEKRQQQQRRAA